MFDSSAESQGAEIEYNVSHSTDRKPAASPIQPPVSDADKKNNAPDQQAGAKAGQGSKLVKPIADNDRLCGRNDRQNDGHNNNDCHPFALGSEIGNDPFRQVTVFILAVVFFFVKAFVETHNFL